MGKGSAQSARTPVEAPNTLQSRSTARIIDLISEGEIEGVVGGLKGIYLDDTPIQNADGSFNFSNIIIDARAGTPDQASISGFPAVESILAVGVEIKNSTPVVRAISNADATAALVAIRLDALQSVNTSSGDINATSVQIAIDNQLDGGAWSDVSPANVVFSGKTGSAYQRAFRIQRPGPGDWAIRVRRITADNSSATLSNKTYWDNVTEIEDYQLQYPHSALLAYQVDAESFGGNVPKRLARVRLLRTRIPSNYDPIARTYTGLWDGTFKNAWHSNPAWALFECISNDRWGIGEYVPDAFRDKWTLYSIGQYCDESVPDGFGGIEPRYTFNFVFATAVEALRVLMSIASVFRGMIYWGAAGVTASADRALDPVKLVTPANVIGGLINWGGGSLKARHTVAIVTWYDPDDFCRPAYEVVEGSPADIARFGYRTMEVVAVGCTSRGQAHRMGRWAIETEASEAETCGWQAAWDHSDVYPGEIVAVADPAYSGVQFGGRVAGLTEVSGAVVGLVLDRPITLEAGKRYELNVTLGDGTVATRPVTTGVTTTPSLSFDIPLSPAPIVNAIWVLTASDLAPKLVKVIKRSEINGKKGTYDLAGIFHDPTKFDRIEQNLVLEAPTYTALPSGPLIAPTNLRSKEHFALAGGSTVTSNVLLSWTAPADPRVVAYQIQDRPPGQNWQNVGSSGDVSYTVQDLSPGVWGFRVRSTDALGRTSPWLTIDAASLDGLLASPDDVTSLRSSYVADITSLTWAEITEIRPFRYEVRLGSSPDTAVVLGTVAHPPFATQGDGLYWVAAYVGPDAGPRIYSGWQSIEIEGSLLSSNIILSWDEAALNWPGVFSGGAGRDGANIRTGGSGDITAIADITTSPDLTNIGGQSSGYYTAPFAHIIDAGRVGPCAVGINWQGVGSPVGLDITTIADWTTNPDLLGSASSRFINVVPQIRTSNGPAGDITLSPDITAADDIPHFGLPWSPWQDFIAGSYIGRYFQARLFLETMDPTVIAYALKFKWWVDVPDRNDHLTNLIVSPAGLAIKFRPDGSIVDAVFNGGPNGASTPNVQVTIQNAELGDHVSLTNKTLTGVTLQILDASGSGVARTVDLLVRGY